MKSEKSLFNQVVVIFVVIFNLSPAYAKKNKISVKPNDSVSAILKKFGLQTEHLSLLIQNDEETVQEINAKQKKIPASVSKILTSYAILKKFPLGSKFLTRLYSDGKNLYLKGGGDPSFVSENMWFMVNEFLRSNIKTIEGDLIVDDSLFDQVRFDESREDRRVDRAYDAPVGAMSFNWNAVNIFIKPGNQGQKAIVYVDPDNNFFELQNNTQTVLGSVKKELVVSIQNKERKITVSGDVLLGSKELAVFKNIQDPEVWSGYNLKAFLKQRGVEVKGNIRSGKTPNSALLIVSVDSKNLSYILSDMNKFSNNYVAEMLTKDLVIEDGKTNASLKEGVQVIKNYLNKIDLTNKDFEIENPSGFTRNNQISAYALTKILTTIKNDFSMFPTFLESLPIAGIDGTLKKRMKGTVAEGWVRAKTGYLDGVVSLAGYAARNDGAVLSFSFLYNGPRDEKIVREAFDQILISSLN